MYGLRMTCQMNIPMNQFSPLSVAMFYRNTQLTYYRTVNGESVGIFGWKLSLFSPKTTIAVSFLQWTIFCIY